MLREIDKRIRRHLSTVRQAFRMVIGEVNSAPGVQSVTGTGLADEDLRDQELMQHYGFTSVPLPGTMGVAVPLGGKTSHAVIVATEHSAFRLRELKPGEVAIYTDEGAKMVFRRGRIIEVECDQYLVKCKTWKVEATESSEFKTPTLTASDQMIVNAQLTGRGGLALSNENGGAGGDVATVTGRIRVTEDVVADGISLVNHDHNGDSGGVTSNPRR